MSAPVHADTEITRRAAESLYAAGANLDLDAFLAVLDQNASDQAVATVRITARASGEELGAQERHTVRGRQDR